MIDDMVMRSVYLRPAEDTLLRQLAHQLNVTKSDLIRSAIAVKLIDWLESDDRSRILADLEHGRRDEAAIRAGRGGRRKTLEVSSRGKVGTVAAPIALPVPAQAEAADAEGALEI